MGNSRCREGVERHCEDEYPPTSRRAYRWGHAMKKLSGWQKAGVIAGVGCFSILGVLVIGLAVAVVWARSTLAELGDTAPTTVERTISVGPAAVPAAPGSRPAGSASPAAPAAGDAPLKLTIDLQEGSFTVR